MFAGAIVYSTKDVNFIETIEQSSQVRSQQLNFDAVVQLNGESILPAKRQTMKCLWIFITVYRKPECRPGIQNGDDIPVVEPPFA